MTDVIRTADELPLIAVAQYQLITCPICGKSVKVTVGFTIPNHREPRIYRSQHHELKRCPASGRRLRGKS